MLHRIAQRVTATRAGESHGGTGRLLFCITVLLITVGCSPTAVLNISSGGLPDGSDRAVAYGELPRQRYDIYKPGKITANTPVVVFFYGGSWSRGSRSNYAFVGNALSDEGLIAAVVDYRVYPEVVYPGFVEDGAKAVLHIKRTIGSGRDLFVAGHSAGAHIAALLAFDNRYLGSRAIQPCAAVRGFIGLSGPYDFLPLRRQRYRDIFPEALREHSQPINYVGADSPPALLVHGTDDTLVVPENSRRLAAGLRANGIDVTTVFLDGAGHIRPVAALSDTLDFLAPVRSAIATFVQNVQLDDQKDCR